MFLQLRLKDPYDPGTRIPALLSETAAVSRQQPFAADLAVVGSGQTDDSGFSPGSGVLCSASGGEALFSKDAFARMNPASTTKILTCLLAIESGDLSRKITVGDEIVFKESGVSLAGLKKGDTLTMEQLLYAVMLPSGGDAANAAAVAVSGDIGRFTDLMNRRAAAIGAVSTHFANAEGLTDDNHYTTAYDIYLILHEAMKNETFRKIAGTAKYSASYTAADGTAVTKTWTNTNLYLGGQKTEPKGLQAVAGKTGTTLAAGSCLALVSKNTAGDLYYSIVLKAANRNTLYDSMNLLLEKIVQ